MNPPVGRREYFALEAGENLERLALLITGAAAPDLVELVRIARTIRGAALLGGPPGYASVAASLEHLAKAARDGALTWTPLLADRVADAIESCKALLRKVREWSDTEARRCERLADELDALAGGADRAAPGLSAGGAMTAGVRAYIARETAAVAATLEQVAEAIERHPGPESAEPVVRRLQPLRGLGALPGLSPLPELLEALDLTLAFAGRGGAWPPAAGRALHLTAHALARIARDIAELGVPQPDSHELVQATVLLRATFADEDDVVPVASLFAAGDREAVMRRGTPPAPPPAGSGLTVELVSLGDRLRLAADQTRESAGTARALLLHALALGLRGLAMSSPVQGAAGEFLRRLDRAVITGRAEQEAEVFAGLLRRAAQALSTAAEAETTARLAEALLPLGVELERLGGQVPAAPEQDILPIEALAPSEPEVVPVEALAPSEPEVVPVEALAPSEPEAPIVEAPEPDLSSDIVPIDTLAPAEDEDGELIPIESLAPDSDGTAVPIESLFFDAVPATPPGRLPFEETFSTYHRLLHREAAPAPEVVPIEALAPEVEVIPIQSLLYRGRSALERARVLHRQLDAAFRSRRDITGVETLFAELLDLVPLALDDDR
jgi:hypothetical protein